MVENARCVHCGAACRRPVTKQTGGQTLAFCCAGCLQVYEFLHEDDAAGAPAPRSSQAAPSLSAAGGAAAGETVRLSIAGMSCANCVATVERSLAGVPGVIQASVSLAQEQATVVFDPRRARSDQMAAAVRGAGYAVSSVHGASTS